MSVAAASAVLAGLIAVSLALAAVLARTRGRGRAVRPSRAGSLPELPIADAELGDTATFVQFGMQSCAPCRATARRIQAFAAENSGVRHIEFDISRHPDLASKLKIVGAPTTFLLDSHGNIRVRISGLPHPDELVHHVESLAPANDTNQPGAVDVHA